VSVRKRKGACKRPWQVDYRDGQGHRRSKQFATKKEADTFASTAAVEVREGIHVADRATVTVKEAGDFWLASVKAAGLERSTTEQYATHLRLHINPFIGATKLSNLNVPRVRAFADELRNKDRSSAMVRKVLVSLGSLLADAQERGLTARNPVRDMRRGRRHQIGSRRKLQVGADIPTPAEIRSIVHAAQGRWRAALIVAIFTGVRSSELRAIRWQDVDLVDRKLNVRQRVDRYGKIGPPKSKAGTRSIPLFPIVVNTLRELKLASERNDADLVFANKNGRPVSHADLINGGLLPTLLAAGLVSPALDKHRKSRTGKRGRPLLTGKYTGLHAFRHWFASWCINCEADGGLALPYKSVQYRLGHATLAITTDTYGHLFPENHGAERLAAGEAALLGDRQFG
jgi:integrase